MKYISVSEYAFQHGVIERTVRNYYSNGLTPQSFYEIRALPPRQFQGNNEVFQN